MARKKHGPRQSVRAAVVTAAEKRAIRAETTKKFRKDGWGFIRKNETVDMKQEDSAMSDFPVHGFRRESRPIDILKVLLPSNLVQGTLEKRGDDRLGGLMFNKGKGRTYTVKSSIFNAWSILAVKVLIQGWQDKKKSVPQAVRDAVHDLHHSNPKIVCATTMNRLLNLFWFEVDSVDEFQISEYMADVFTSFGDSVAGDEKLWKYAGASGYIRLVINKPSRMGLWMFQAAVRLKCGLPCLIYTKMHTSTMENRRVIKCFDTVKAWADMITERITNGRTVLYMDSYYLTEEGREYLRRKKVLYVASITRGRFGTIVDTMERKLDKSGTHINAYNRSTKEAATYCWSLNPRLGKKFVIASGYEVVGKAQNDHVCPLYDHYCAGFNGCDLFNRALHGKSWPYKLQGDVRNASDYLLTAVLINTFHLWIDAGNLEDRRHDVKWDEFCTMLAHEMVE